MQRAKAFYWTEQDYLQAEREAAVRHEYIAGNIYAMAGAGKNHNIIALNIASLLRSHLRGSPCRTFIADMKVRVGASKAYYYPDIVVSCSAQDIGSDSPKDFLLAPRLIVEVLSDSTENIDRREKMTAYFQLKCVQEYVLVDSRRQKLEVFCRQDNGEFIVAIAERADTVMLHSLEITLAMQDIYEDVVFDNNDEIENL